MVNVPGAPARKRRRLGLLSIAIALIGCRSVLPGPASPEELRGPWRPMPLIVGPEVRAEFDAACRADQAMPDGLSLVLMDARGEGRLIVGYADGGGSEAWLHATIGADPPTKCQMMSTTEHGAPLLLGERELRPSNQGSVGADGWWSMVGGHAGTDIEQVVAEVPDSPRIVATLEDGWFAFWWRERGQPQLMDVRLIGLDSSGTEIAEWRSP